MDDDEDPDDTGIVSLGGDDKLEDVCDLLGVGIEERLDLGGYLSLLSENGLQRDYAHSVRTGINGFNIARFFDLEPLGIFRAFLLHDIGKYEDADLFKRQKWNGDQVETHRKKLHPRHSWRLLRGKYPFEAEVVKRHHRYQEDGYPGDEELVFPPDFDFTDKEKVESYSKLLAIADAYDAITNRNGKPVHRKEVRGYLFDRLPDLRVLINDCFVVFDQHKGSFLK